MILEKILKVTEKKDIRDARGWGRISTRNDIEKVWGSKLKIISARCPQNSGLAQNKIRAIIERKQQSFTCKGLFNSY